MSDVLNSVNSKLADSLHTSNDMLESIASSISKVGSDNKEVLGDIGSKLENGQTKIATAIDTASDMIDHVKDEVVQWPKGTKFFQCARPPSGYMILVLSPCQS